MYCGGSRRLFIKEGLTAVTHAGLQQLTAGLYNRCSRNQKPRFVICPS